MAKKILEPLSVSPTVAKICCICYDCCCLLQILALRRHVIFSLAMFLQLALISAFTVSQEIAVLYRYMKEATMVVIGGNL